MYCTQCGTALGENGNFCPGCGTPVAKAKPSAGPMEPSPSEQRSAEPSGSVPEAQGDEELRLFVGEKKANYYLKKWKNAKKNNQSWNWAAFLGGFLWAGYRKMYHVILIGTGIFLVFDIITLFLSQEWADRINYGITTATGVVLGLSGNYYYSLTAKKKIDKIKAAFPNNFEKQQTEIKKQGGGSWKGVFISVAILLGYLIINMGLFTAYDSYVQRNEVKSAAAADDRSSDQADDSDNAGEDENSDTASSDGTVSTDTPSAEADDSSEVAADPADETAEATTTDEASMTYEQAFDNYMQENGIRLTAKDVQFDMKNNLDQDFAIFGTAELDTYYNYGFADIEDEYFSVDITPFDGEYGDNWNLYFSRKDFGELFDTLKANGTVTIAATGIIPSSVYEDDQGNLAAAKQATWWKNN
ncbi:DUF2628 domain-containing protein [Neobacillus dielmonensis]|uniref:DUF2628 domain-containing protein n=1 Tax=Neobacillus dielmonensis TaxID=1347369 RepID=UPI000693ED79|nr:DUF2628 domain-containing protein [Neobacillus dielmonensis]